MTWAGHLRALSLGLLILHQRVSAVLRLPHVVGGGGDAMLGCGGVLQAVGCCQRQLFALIRKKLGGIFLRGKRGFKSKSKQLCLTGL